MSNQCLLFLLTVSGEPQTQSVVIIATVGWTLFGGHLLLDLVFFVRLVFQSLIMCMYIMPRSHSPGFQPGGATVWTPGPTGTTP